MKERVEDAFERLDMESDGFVSFELLKSREVVGVLERGGNILDSRELMFFFRSSVGMRVMLGPRTVLMGTGTIISASEERRKE